MPSHPTPGAYELCGRRSSRSLRARLRPRAHRVGVHLQLDAHFVLGRHGTDRRRPRPSSQSPSLCLPALVPDAAFLAPLRARVRGYAPAAGRARVARRPPAAGNGAWTLRGPRAERACSGPTLRRPRLTPLAFPRSCPRPRRRAPRGSSGSSSGTSRAPNSNPPGERRRRIGPLCRSRASQPRFVHFEIVSVDSPAPVSERTLQHPSRAGAF